MYAMHTMSTPAHSDATHMRTTRATCRFCTLHFPVQKRKDDEAERVRSADIGDNAVHEPASVATHACRKPHCVRVRASNVVLMPLSTSAAAQAAVKAAAASAAASAEAHVAANARAPACGLQLHGALLGHAYVL